MMDMLKGSVLWWIFFVSAAAFLQFRYGMKEVKRRERVYVALLLGGAGLFGAIVLLFPQMPGPNDMTKWLFASFGKWLES